MVIVLDDDVAEGAVGVEPPPPPQDGIKNAVATASNPGNGPRIEHSFLSAGSWMSKSDTVGFPRKFGTSGVGPLPHT